MVIWDWFLGLFDKGQLSLDAQVGALTTEIFYKEMALQSCMNLIAGTISQCEFLTYEKGIEVKKSNYYTLNVRPNQNQNASAFWKAVIKKLIYENECLVVEQNGNLYVAESFVMTEFAFKENIYSNITVANYETNLKLSESQVFHFKLNNEKAKLLIDGLYDSYSKLIAASRKGYIKGKTKRYTSDIPTSFSQQYKDQNALNDLLKERFKTFFEAEGDSVMPLTNGQTLKEIDEKGISSTSVEGRNIRAFIDDIYDFTAIILNIPPLLIRGGVADTNKLINDLITFCIKPIATMLTQEINNKMYKMSAYLERTYCKLDTTRIKYNDLKDIAYSLDILTRIGAHNVDDNLKQLGKEPYNEDWSQARFMTKNYELIKKLVKGDE